MKRIILLGVLGLIFLAVEILNWTCLILDNIFFPAWRKTPVKAPVFIVGMPRTGTTWLQSILSADQKQFSSMKLWEILFAPSILQKKFFIMLDRLDGYMNHALKKQLQKIDNRVFEKYRPMHPVSFFDFGEDDLLLVHIFSGLFLIFLFPSVRNLNAIIRFDEYKNELRNKRIIGFFKKCIQRHMFVFGTHKTYLSKSPNHTPKMKYLSQLFPDNRYICMARTPEQIIPSAISLFIRFCDVYHTPYTIETIVERTFSMADYWFPHPLFIFRDLSPDRYIVINYPKLTADLMNNISGIYEKFRLDFTNEYKACLEKLQATSYISAHRYSAEKYGLNAEAIKIKYNSFYLELINHSNYEN